MTSYRATALALVQALVAGCGGGDTADGGAGPPDLAAPADLASVDLAAAADLRPTGVAMHGRIRDFTERTPLAGVTVCLTDPKRMPCHPADAMGSYLVPDLPIGANVVVHFQKPDYLVQQIMLAVPAVDVRIVTSMVTWAEAEALGAIVGLPKVDRTKGFMTVAVTERDEFTDSASGLPYLKVSLDKPHGDGPYYFDANRLPDVKLKETTSSGTVTFAHLTPGEYLLTARHPTRTCKARAAWAGPAPNTFRVRITAGAHSVVYIYCI